jgi:hypothetical protein
MEEDWERCLLYWSIALEHNHFNLSKGLVSTTITPQGQLRFPPKDQRKITEKMLSFLVQPRDWHIELSNIANVNIHEVRLDNNSSKYHC